MGLELPNPPDSTIRTTDATAISGGTYMLPPDSAVVVFLTILAHDVSDKSNAAIWTADYRFLRAGTGAAVLMGIGNKVRDHSGGSPAATWDMDMIANADGTFTIRLTGSVATTVDWTVTGRMEGLY